MMPEISIETIIQTLSYGGIFLLMITNGASSIPSSQVLYIITGYFVAQGNLSFTLAVCAGALGNTVGTAILYELARKHGRTFIERIKIFPVRELSKIEVAFKKKGAWFVFVGKLLPAIKVYIPIPAGLGKMHRGFFSFLMFTASAIWATGFISIGYFFGKSSDLFGRYALILIIISVIVLFLFYRYINSKEVIDSIEK